MASAFDTLPDELLFEIFSKCLPPNRWEITPNPFEAPTSFTLVCKRWRSVALGVPSLWSWMRIWLSPYQLNWRNRGAARHISSRIGDVLGRSKPRPLNVMLSFTKRLDAQSLATPYFLSDLLTPISPSLTRLVLHRVPLVQMCSLPQGLFPSLQSLVYIMAGSGNWLAHYGSQQPVIAFADAPSLRRVALDTVFFFTGNLMFTLPWNQLTHFRNFDVAQPCAALFSHGPVTQSSSLQWLGFDITDEDIGRSTVDNRVVAVMGGVTTLSLSFEWGLESGELEYPDIFQRVEFPNLRTLRLAALEVLDDLDDFQEELLAKLKTFKRLEFLSLRGNSIGSYALETILERVPTIRILHLDTDASYGPAFRLLDAEKDLLPLLDTLVLDSGVGNPRQFIENKIHASLLSRLLNSRKPGAHPTSHIRRIVVWGGEPTDLDDTQSYVGVIQRFMKENRGLEFAFDRRLRRVEERKFAMWMEMDPGFCGWEEAVVAEKLWKAVQNDDSSSVDTSASDEDSD